jgi:acetyltransferase-like isoleucine patch superfamily enzyme
MLYKIKRYVRDHEKLMFVLSSIYTVLCRNHFRGRKGVKLCIGGAFLKTNKIINSGTENQLFIEKGSRVYNCKFLFRGKHNRIYIGHDCVCRNMDFIVSEGATITIGNHSHFEGNIHLACIEGRTISIGERCLFSSEIVFRTSDSHSILDVNGNRINHAKDIYVGNHVWVGHRVTVLKGTEIGENSIIGTGAIVTNETYIKNSIIAGVPARVIRTDINWYHELK